MMDYKKIWSSLRRGDQKHFPKLREAMDRKRKLAHPNSIHGMLLSSCPTPELLIKELKEMERWDHEDIPSFLKGLMG